MAINFEIPEHIKQQNEMVKMVAEHIMRPISREMDEHEHERPWPFIDQMWPFMRDMQKSNAGKAAKPPTPAEKSGAPAHDQPAPDADDRDAVVGRRRDLPVPARRRARRRGD